MIKSNTEVYDTLSHIIPPFIKSKYKTFIHLTTDIINDVYIKLHNKNAFNPNKGSHYSYYISITQNHIIDLMRKQTSHNKRIDNYNKLNNTSETLKYDNNEQETLLMTNLTSIINKLTRVEQEIFKDLFIKNLKLKEIYTKLNISLKVLNRYKSKLLYKLQHEILNNQFLYNYLIDNNIQILNISFNKASDIKTRHESNIIYQTVPIKIIKYISMDLVTKRLNKQTFYFKRISIKEV